ncbi:MAG: hypothetical protein KDE22_05535 [Rhodobacterales bacterium]|nr:hypothetical protein [Rhodobacterales bacterium]
MFRWLLVLLLSALLGSAPARADAPMERGFATASRPLLADPADAKSRLGQVFVATPVAVLERRGGLARVRVEGWHQDGADRLLYALQGKRIRRAILKKDSTGILTRLDSLTDPATGQLWHRVAFEAWTDARHLAPAADPLWEEAEMLFSTRCTSCHERRIPHKYTANQWVGLLKVMGPRTGLPKDKQQLILKFLQFRAKDTRDLPAGD